MFKNDSLKISFLTLVACCCSPFLLGQYAPEVGVDGTTAMHKDSSAFVGWATSCKVVRGPMNATSVELGYSSVGAEVSAIGKATGLEVVSLGDGGTAILQFGTPISDQEGPDFAVFENSFSNDFLELAFVEVSSDGIHYHRFPSHSLTTAGAQVASFGSVKATEINNLAGKYKANYGTPFDLNELKGKANLEINKITHVKVIDVVGAIDTSIASYDSKGNVINDPWPTAFASSGFDLDAVGVIHSAATSINDIQYGQSVTVYPNPAKDRLFVKSGNLSPVTTVELVGISGKIHRSVTWTNGSIDVSSLENGLYVLRIVLASGSILTKKIKVIHD